ncbi:hypothetical protein Bca101_058987 [Brassica carinata]
MLMAENLSNLNSPEPNMDKEIVNIETPKLMKEVEATRKQLSTVMMMVPRETRERESVLMIVICSNWKTHTTNLWSSIEVEFVVKFDIMTVETKKKDEIMRDPLAFKDGEEYYKRIGKAWKRGYLLYKEKNEEDREDKSDEEASDLEEEIRVDKVSEWTDYSVKFRNHHEIQIRWQKYLSRIVRETDANLTKHTEDWLINLDEASKLHEEIEWEHFDVKREELRKNTESINCQKETFSVYLRGELDNIQEERDALRNQHKRKLDDNGVENPLNKMKRRENNAVEQLHHRIELKVKVPVKEQRVIYKGEQDSSLHFLGHNIIELGVPGCTRISIDDLVSILRDLKSADQWCNKAIELQEQLEEANMMKRADSDSLVSLTKQLEGRNKRLMHAVVSEMTDLKNKAKLMAMVGLRQSQDLYKSEQLLETAAELLYKVEKEAMKSELETVEKEKKQDLKKNHIILEEKINIRSKVEEEKSEIAMQSLASVLHQVWSEARVLKEELLSLGGQDYEIQVEHYKNMTEVTQVSEVEQIKVRETGLFNDVKKFDEENCSMRRETNRLGNLVKRISEETDGALKKESLMRDYLKEVEDDAIYLQEALREARAESLKLNSKMLDKETEFQSILHENDFLRVYPLVMCHSLMMFLLLVTSSSYGRFTMKISEGDISTICSKTKNPSFCLNFFKSTPATKTLDLFDVAKFLINDASQDASVTQKQFESLAKSTADPRSKNIYIQCLENYKNALGEFDAAIKALEAKDNASLNIKVSAAMTDGDSCNSELPSVKPNPQLLKQISDIDNPSGIVLVISNIMPKN